MLVSGSARTSAPALQSSPRLPVQDNDREQREGKVGANFPAISSTPSLGSKLADALWSMESSGVVLDQKPGDIWIGDKPKTAVSEEFLDISEMTPAERIRYFFLDDRDLNEELLAEMTPEEQEAIEAQIRELILLRLGLEDEDGKPGDDTPAPTVPEEPIMIDGQA